MVDKHKVTIGAENEKAITLHLPNKMVKFRQLNNWLWVLDPADETSYMSYKDCKISKASENGGNSKV